MSTRTQALEAQGNASRHEWQLLVAGLVAVLVVFLTLVVLAKVNAPSSSTVPPGTKSVGHTQPTVVVGGDTQYQYHPLP